VHTLIAELKQAEVDLKQAMETEFDRRVDTRGYQYWQDRKEFIARKKAVSVWTMKAYEVV